MKLGDRRGVRGSNRSLIRFACGWLAATWGLVADPVAAMFTSADGPPRRFAIPAGEASETLRQFTATAEQQVIFMVDVVQGVRTNAVAGDYPPRIALEKMIAGTGLERVVDPNSNAWMIGQRPALAPTPGVIIGRIANPANGEYVRHARIRADASDLATTSGVGGEFRLAAAGPGPVTLSVSFTGYQTVTTTVNVPAGGVVRQDFEIVSQLASATARADEPVRLSALVVPAEREGAAKAIMEQRSSMNITHTVASDSFGDNPEGNIGEFMRHLPGVELDVFFGEVRTVRLSGLPSDYTAVTMDGMPLASVDAGTSGAGNSRAFTMEMASLNSVESIEISRTVSADVDAHAPAGTINLRTKRAFDRASRHVAWQANVTAHSEAFTTRRTLGPDEELARRKLRPGGIFEYSDTFFDRRLGIILNVTESNVYQEAVVAAFTYHDAPGDPRPLAPASLSYQWAPRFNRRSSVTFSADARLSPALDAGLGLVYNLADLWTPQRRVTFNTGTRAGIAGHAPLLAFVSAPNGSVQVNPAAIAKTGETVTLLPRLAYRRNGFEFEAKGSYSNSSSRYNPLGRHQSIRDFNGPTASNVSFRAERSSPLTADWRFVQLGGPDLADGANYSSPAFTANDGRSGRTVLAAGELTASGRNLAGSIPISWKTGLKTRHHQQTFADDTLAWRTDRIGVSSHEAWAGYASPWPYRLSLVNSTISTASGRELFIPNLHAMGEQYRRQPSAFQTNWGTNAVNYYESYVARDRRLRERVDASFIMVTGAWRQLLIRAGLRWENTSVETGELSPRPPDEVRDLGFTVGANGIASSVPGIQYQYFSRPRTPRHHDYAQVFPSAALKYSPTKYLDAQLALGRTIRRPSYAALAGAWLINESDLSVSVPNPQLRPEQAGVLSARLAGYFEPVGQLSLTASQLTVNDAILSNRVSAQAFGPGSADFARYDYITSVNGPDRVIVRSLGLDYNQNLGFLGAGFRRCALHGSYTRYTTSSPRTSFTPHLATGGLSYSLGPVRIMADWTWSADMTRNATGTAYRRHHANLDVGATWRLTKSHSLSVNARNLTNVPWIDLQRFDSGDTAVTRYESVGTSWTFALKATY
jgi:iron complex outermembrane receptor protein